MIFRPSGGLLYHWRALRSRSRWQAFAVEIEDWLSAWNPPRAHLLLIGPSAGYTLPSRWLESFARVTAYDTDPLASFFFRRRHPSANAEFKRTDVFWNGGRLSAGVLKRELAKHPQACVLFSNVLGQLLLEGTASEDEWLAFLRELRGTLNGRVWASYHDIFTHEDGEVIDHLLTGEWREGLARREFRWPLTEKSLHLIEGVHSL